ncbi:MAG TPA: phosphoglycerate kinase, partial [bacterium]|nr:phosphoglycerate kinase [bacterium]
DLAKAIAKLKTHTVAGGGETALLIKKAGLNEKFSYVSTGGGASLDLLRNGTLPGLDVLK